MISVDVLKKKISDNNFLISEFKKTADKHYRYKIKDQEIIDKSFERIKQLKKENTELKETIDILENMQEDKC